MYSWLFCLTLLICILNQASTEHPDVIKHPSLVGNLLRMSGNIKYHLADTADNTVNAVLGFLQRGSDAVVKNGRRVGDSVDKSLDATDNLVRTGLNTGRDYLDTGYTIISTPPRVASDVVNNILDELKTYTESKKPLVTSPERLNPVVPAPPHVEYVDGSGRRQVLSDEELLKILSRVKSMTAPTGKDSAFAPSPPEEIVA